MTVTVEESIARLNRLANSPLSKFKDYVTSELCSVSQSTLSYFATVNPKQDELTMIGWSTSAMVNCAMISKPLLYKVVETGLWGDAIRERKPVITNDYPKLIKSTKKGYPQGHVNVRRHMNLPLFEAGKVVVVVGVGNKAEPYTLEDAKIVEQVMSAAWAILKTKL